MTKTQATELGNLVGEHGINERKDNGAAAS
jgi:hypothetical protein